MLLAAVSFNILTVAAVLAVMGAIVAGITAFRKLGPEKDALYITSAQGAAVIMDGLVDTLREEVDRCRARLAFVEAENERLLADNERLSAANLILVRRVGKRPEDRKR